MVNFISTMKNTWKVVDNNIIKLDATDFLVKYNLDMSLIYIRYKIKLV